MYSLSILIVNYNLTESIKNLLTSIQKFVKDINYEIILVDNNSTDRTIEELKPLFPEVRFIYLKTNLGFGRGNNVAAQVANGKYLLLLNPDTYLVNNMPLKLFNFAEQYPEFAIVGPRLIFPDGSFQLSTSRFPSVIQEIGNLSGLSIPSLRVINFFKYKIFKKLYYEVDYIFGSCMLINSNLFKEINGFDEDYFLFAEEADLCYRVKKKTKYKIAYYIDSSIVHEKSMITGKNLALRMKLGYESKLKFFQKHYSAIKVLIIRYVIIIMLIFKFLSLFKNKQEKTNFKIAYRQIIRHYLRN